MPTDEILTLEIEPPYIGSAVSPTVDIDETTDDITVTITDFRGEHSYTVEKTDQAIEDAEQAAQNANDTAQTVAQGWASKLAEINGTLAQQREQMGSAATAESQRVTAENARVAAENAREQEWNELSTNVTTATSSANEAAGQANTAAQGAIGAANAADDATTRANNTITGITQTANQIFAQAGQATENANAAAQSANTAATNANTKAGLADTAAQNADTATTAANNAAQTATTAAEQADAAREAIQDDLGAKADKDGYYQQLTAGLADTLMSGDSELVQFAKRVSDRDGMARVESLRGNTVRWNQLIDVAYGSKTQYGISYSGIDGKVTASGTSTSSGWITVGSAAITTHKYFVAARQLVIGSTDTTSGVMILGNYSSSSSAILTTETPAKIFDNTNGSFKYYRFAVNTGSSAGFVIDKSFYPQVFDLTTMFGAGNEPVTVAEFEALFPEDYYPYDAGSLLSVNIDGIQSAGTLREIPASTYFPDGMRSAGAAYDELDFAGHKAVKRIGAVDLGTLTWIMGNATTDETGVVFRVNSFSNIGATKDNNIICAQFTKTAQKATWEDATLGDIFETSSGTLIAIGSTSYTSAAAFKAAMSGVMLQYKLATPTETTIPETLQATYSVEMGGTESIVIPTGEQSAPPTMAIVYGYTADGVRDETQSIVAPVERGVASSNYAVGAYLVMGGTLYRVTTAIATGETINPGTNCTATTVMAEIVRLTA